jgi:hypothetical protein
MWITRSIGSSIKDQFLSSSDPAIEEEVTRPIDRDRARTTAWKGKGKEDSSSQSQFSSVVSAIISTLKKLRTSFAKAQLWK